MSQSRTHLHDPIIKSFPFQKFTFKKFPLENFPLKKSHSRNHTQDFPTQKLPTQERPTQELPTQELPTQEPLTQEHLTHSGQHIGDIKNKHRGAQLFGTSSEVVFEAIMEWSSVLTNCSKWCCDPPVPAANISLRYSDPKPQLLTLSIPGTCRSGTRRSGHSSFRTLVIPDSCHSGHCLFRKIVIFRLLDLARN